MRQEELGAPMQTKIVWTALAALAMVAVAILPGGAHAAAPATLPAAHPSVGVRVGSTLFTSSNWAGYVAQNTSGSTNFSVTKVSAHWVQPAVSCANPATAIVVIWVGIDGAFSNTVEQTGSYAQCVGGSASYLVWWELYPKNSIQPISTISVKAGDTITASVVYSSTSGKYTMKVADGTKSFSKTATQTGTLRSSAECIVERPSSGTSLYDLANFSKATISGCTATINGHSGAIGSFPQVDQINMVGNNGVTVIATTSALTSKKTFTVTWNGYS
jgi:hypothetical protein